MPIHKIVLTSVLLPATSLPVEWWRGYFANTLNLQGRIRRTPSFNHLGLERLFATYLQALKTKKWSSFMSELKGKD